MRNSRFARSRYRRGRHQDRLPARRRERRGAGGSAPRRREPPGDRASSRSRRCSTTSWRKRIGDLDVRPVRDLPRHRRRRSPGRRARRARDHEAHRLQGEASSSSTTRWSRSRRARPDQPGVVVIAGTGSIAYGRNERNQAARAGGWGYMLGDEGSGYWIGRAALRAVLREADRRGPATQLTGLLLNYYGVARAQDLIHQVYHGTLRPSAIAVARAVRPGGVHRRRPRRDRHPPRLRGRARVVGALGRRAPGSGRLGVSVRPRRAAFSARCRGSKRSCRAGCRSRRPAAAPSCSNVEPAVGAVRLALAEARGGYTVPAYKAD